MASNRMDLAGYLKSQGVWHRFLQKPETVHTADASAATGIDLARITKNLVCTTSDDHYALLIVPGNRRVNLERAAQALNTPNVQLLAFGEAESISGYPPGATPSVHHKTKMNVIVDVGLLSYETIFCGGGSRDKLLELKIEDVVRLDQAAIVDISEK